MTRSTESATKTLPGDEASLVRNGADSITSTSDAVHDLRDSLGRAWQETREAVRNVGESWRRGAKNAGAEARHAANETRDHVGAAMNSLGEVGGEIGEETAELARNMGAGVRRYVRAHPLRSLAIAAGAGFVLTQLFRAGRR